MRMHALEQERRALDKQRMEAYASRVAQQISRQESAAAQQEADEDAELYKQVRIQLFWIVVWWVAGTVRA